jgi:DNA-binding response OmpR family regulator
MRLLVIEDQKELAENIRDFLRLETYAVTVRHTGTTGLQEAMTEPFDLIILDINLPEMDGFTLCEHLRESGNKTPILMLTARDASEDIVHGLNIGADDYLTKPFKLDELLARVRSLVRRSKQESQPLLHFGDITMDTNALRVTRDGSVINLTPKQYSLLEFQLRNRGKAQTSAAIIDHVWGRGDDLMFSQTVEVHVAHLRRKLGKDVIHTVMGTGYLIP